MKKFLPVFLILTFCMSVVSYAIPKLSSYPSAKATIFFDFDGQTVSGTSWNGGATFYCAPANLTDDQITEIFNRVAEDYRPFNINITTDSTVFLAAPLTQRVRIIVTPTSGWYPGVGGISFTGSFIWGDDTPGFVFPDRLANNPKIIAECCTHESGHTIGLSHQAKYNDQCTLLSTYNEGNGSGEISWAPVMGNSYYRNVSGWNNGPTPSGCTADQDNLSIITSRNGFTYRTDDHSDDPAVNPTQINIVNAQFASDGIITTNTDKDAFKITLPKDGKLQLNADPYSVGPNNDGANLDIQLTLLNSKRQLVKVYNPEDKLNVTVDTSLMAGDYYVVVNGTGNANTSNYGSLGSYRISGVFSPYIILPVSQVLLSGESSNGKHNLNWSIISDEPVKAISVESSKDGGIFSMLANVQTNDRSFSYSPLIDQNIFYRLKVTGADGKSVYSNVIPLKGAGTDANALTISTLVQNEIKIKSSERFQYQLADISGKIIKTGNGDAGVNTINIQNSPNGIYILQVICNSRKTTQRIVRM